MSDLTPFNGDYYDEYGETKNLLGVAETGTERPNDSMSPSSGEFYAGDGSIHSLAEIAGGAGGGGDIPFTSGPWTPTIVEGDVHFDSTPVARYTRIGNLIFAWAQFRLYPNEIPNSDTTRIKIGGLPFRVNYSANMNGWLFNVYANATSTAGLGMLTAMPRNNENAFTLTFVTGNAQTALSASNHRTSIVVYDVFIIYPTDQ